MGGGGFGGSHSGRSERLDGRADGFPIRACEAFVHASKVAALPLLVVIREMPHGLVRGRTPCRRTADSSGRPPATPSPTSSGHWRPPTMRRHRCHVSRLHRFAERDHERRAENGETRTPAPDGNRPASRSMA